VGIDNFKLLNQDFYIFFTVRMLWCWIWNYVDVESRTVLVLKLVRKNFTLNEILKFENWFFVFGCWMWL